MNKRTRLGRGLDALFGDSSSEDSNINNNMDELDDFANQGGQKAENSLKYIPLDKLKPSSLQPRKLFNTEEIEELAKSINDKGVLQPLLARELKNKDDYEIIAGERRWRAAQLARLHEVPVIIKKLNDTELLEVALVENLQRSDLSPIEEANGYKKLMDDYHHSQEELSRLIGKSRPHVANMVRLLNLPDEIKNLLDKGKLSMGHARALIGVSDSIFIADKVVREGLSVRVLEKLIAKKNNQNKSNKHANNKIHQGKDADTLAIESRIEEALGLKVNIKFDGKGGQLIFYYSDLEQLDDLVKRVVTPRN